MARCYTAVHADEEGNFRSFAFIHAKDPRPWSVLRGEAFQQELKRHSRTCDVFPPNDFDPELDRARLTDFLRRLERPAAVFAAWDNRAIQALESAREARIVLPDEMAVLGVDDEILCEHTHPPLASIRPDNESEGYAAAETLDNMINGRKWHASTLCPISGDILFRAKPRTERRPTSPTSGRCRGRCRRRGGIRRARCRVLSPVGMSASPS